MRFLNTIETGSTGVDVINSSGDWIGNVLATGKIPSLDASKITSGTFATARIPNLDASKITTGTLNAARIPDLSTTYSPISHGHTFASLTAKPTTLAGYGITDAASSSHTHTIANVTGLQTALDGKASTSHNHAGVYDNYGSWNLKTNGVQRTTVASSGTLDITAGTNVSVSYGAGGVVTISSTDTDTNNYVSSATFNTADGVLTLNRAGLGAVTVDLDGRYLQSFTESDPIFSASAASGITSTNISNWNTAYGWGDHATQGYIKSDDQTLSWNNNGTLTISEGNSTSIPIRVYNNVNYVPSGDINQRGNYGIGVTVYEGYSVGTNRPFTYDTTAQFMSTSSQGFEIAVDWVSATSTPMKVRHLRDCCQGWSPWINIWTENNFTSTNISQWNTAYGWGNHASAGYLTSLPAHTHTFASLTSKPTTLSGYGITDAATSGQGAKADSAFGWGDHALAGYLTAIPAEYLTETEANTIYQPIGNYQPAGTYNTIIGTDTDISATGATVISAINMTDGVIESHSTRTLTPANIGAATSSHTHSEYIKNNASGTLTGDFDLAPADPFSWRFGTEESALREVHTQQLFTYGYYESGLKTEGIGKNQTGTVVVATEGGLIPCDSVCNHMVMGVITNGHDSPVVMGAEPVLVTGKVNFGDYLVTSDKVGHAVAVSRDYVILHNLLDCCFAKALESGDGDSYTIKAMINKL